MAIILILAVNVLFTFDFQVVILCDKKYLFSLFEYSPVQGKWTGGCGKAVL